MLRKTIIICLLLTILLPIFVISQVIDDQPTVTSARTPEIADAQRTKRLLQNSWDMLKQNRRAELIVAVDDLNAAISFLARGTSYISGGFNLQQKQLEGTFSLKIPRTPFGEYINLKMTILPSEQGLDLGSCKIGSIPVPGSLLLLLGRSGLDLLSGDQLGSQLLGTVERISFSPGQLQIGFRSGQEFATLKNRLITQLKKMRGDPDSSEELKRIHFYLHQLENINNRQTERYVSFGNIINPLFLQVVEQSRTHSALEENRAALYALAIYLGGREFRQLASYLLNPEQPFPRNRTTRYTLAGRRDLLKHFLVSAGIKLISDVQIGFAVGEFKEMLDAYNGGSGFSFIDLAADRSGLHFAESATASAAEAKRFQQRILAISHESDFFPKISLLEEGLSQRKFIDRYGNVDTERYKEVVSLIDQRLAVLPLYQ
ncbi:hypothetical protein SAMN02745165_02575 [Malonomonas rubra DSM 5091]|uniref:Uncharacterized protein n=1 Tax=Malonomonas rubra DSM 5091 TaxID=1122189 RepID=A0A1M6JZ16_MALRU|nr:hypothetical protein [Malonomonas rubra]SHJ51926.1 hypothetical protein SAMN02745165_02575 [Malonomonas rubra DSM 5091]